ncbi:CRISPR-associated endonuclease Cas1 [Synechococcus sp. F70.1]|uniref:CRISPR-associated endonuclease Cas1 n=1 Tax=Synechococcus sp. F70.1 TaxID=2964532 RepID=UPI0039C6499D
MRTLYVSQQGCRLSLRQEFVLVHLGESLLQEMPLPLLEQILIFGRSQVTTDVVRACLRRNIPIAYLSRLGYCYGRLVPIERGYRRLAHLQQALPEEWRLQTAAQMVRAKLLNSRVLLMRQLRQRPTETGDLTLRSLEHLAAQALEAKSLDQLRGIEGAAAALYFPELGNCLQQRGFVLLNRTRQPPTNPVNAMLSFGYMVLWNHLLTLVELQDLDPYQGCLHASSERHAALVSDLLEEFRAPIVDSLVLWLVNSGVMDIQEDFEYRDGGCFLSDAGRKKYLKAFLQRMEGSIQTPDGDQPRWDLLTQQVKKFKHSVYNPQDLYQPYRIR